MSAALHEWQTFYSVIAAATATLIEPTLIVVSMGFKTGEPLLQQVSPFSTVQ